MLFPCNSLFSMRLFHTDLVLPDYSILILLFLYDFRHKRAAWRWNKDRTRLGGKWSWLLTQIGDVESRLRDYQHAARKLRASRLSAATPTTSVNGFHGVLPSTVPSESDDVCVSCARTRGFDPSAHRKRKVYKIRDLTRTHTKLNVPAPVRCGCTPPRPPCALCAGRPDPTKPRSGLCLEGKRSRIALVDTAYHPNSSFDTGKTLVLSIFCSYLP